jgi:hypothetical protein
MYGLLPACLMGADKHEYSLAFLHFCFCWTSMAWFHFHVAATPKLWDIDAQSSTENSRTQEPFQARQGKRPNVPV